MALQDSRLKSLDKQTEDRATAPTVSVRTAHGERHAHDHKHDHADHYDHEHEHDHDHEHGHGHDHPFEWPEAARIGIVALAAAAVWFRIWEPYPRISVIGVLGLAIGGWPILKEAFENIVERRMTMELSMTIAIVAAAAIGEIFTALVITLFVLVAEVLEGMTVGRGRKAIRDLLEFLPREVSVRRAGSIQSVAAETLTIGDAVLVAPGGRIPVDGTVRTGHSFVDESRITGESMPAEKAAGAHVFAGSINQSGALEINVERIGRDTSYGKIIEAVERAEKSRAPVQRLADRLAGYLVYFALGAAALTFLITHDMRSTISVVIVAGACGIAAGTPLAILGAIGRAARLGAIVKGGIHLETLGQVNTVVLDKTGTLTLGKPDVQKVLPAAGVSPETVLASAAAAELHSEHPLGKAIVAYARRQKCDVTEPGNFAYTPGRGIRADIGGHVVLVGNQPWLNDNGIKAQATGEQEAEAGAEVFVAVDGKLLGSIIVADTIRPEAQHATATLHDMGIRTVLLTGDTRRVATAVGKKLGIEEIEAELLPEQKLQRVRDLVAQKRVVAMVGDGINDAPALARS